MRTVLYPGTFDPITNGHLDILKRACELFDSVIVTIAVNPAKTPLFTIEERLYLIKESVARFENVMVDSFSGLLVDFAKKRGAIGIIRGLRAISDFEYEFQMALMNRKLDENIATIFLMPHEKYTYLNSSIVRDLAALGSDISDFVPDVVQEALKKKFPR